MTSAWQTRAAEPGKADCELALVETGSGERRATCHGKHRRTTVGGRLDPLLLHGMYDDPRLLHEMYELRPAAAQNHVSAHTPMSWSASNAALLPSAPFLALTGPDGAVVGGAPFVSPAYVQMAEIERKKQMLAQESRMWALY